MEIEVDNKNVEIIRLREELSRAEGDNDKFSVQIEQLQEDLDSIKLIKANIETTLSEDLQLKEKENLELQTKLTDLLDQNTNLERELIVE